jgi:hypothetical protein
MLRGTIAADGLELLMPPAIGIDVGDIGASAGAAGKAATTPAPSGGYWGPYASREAAIFGASQALRDVLGDKGGVGPIGRPMRQIVLAIGLAESELGVGPSWRVASGAPSWNFGALTTTNPAQPSIPHPDKDAAGKPIVQAFAAFPDQAAGIKAFLSTWGDAAFIAANTGDAGAVASIMYDRGYYTGVSGTREERIAAYRGMIVGAAGTVAKALGDPLEVTAGPVLPKGAAPTPAVPPSPSSSTSSTSSSGGGAAIAAVTLAGLAFLAFRK